MNIYRSLIPRSDKKAAFTLLPNVHFIRRCFKTEYIQLHSPIT